jgi:hypothetical protein
MIVCERRWNCEMQDNDSHFNPPHSKVMALLLQTWDELYYCPGRIADP